MGNAARRYFVMSEEKSSAFMAEFEKAKAPRQEGYKKLMEAYQADSLLVSRSNFSGESVTALLFTEEPEKCGGWKVEKTVHGDEWSWSVVPDRRFKKGKQLASDIAEANSIQAPSLFSPWAIEQLRMGSITFTSGAMHHAVAGFVGGRVVVSVPVPDPDQEFPEIHADLVEIKKSEFIALTEE